MASRRQRRRREKEQRHAPEPIAVDDGPAERLVYSREQAARILGVSLATLDRRVVPTIATIKTEWGARLIPKTEIDRYLAERTEEPRAQRRQAARTGRKRTLPAEVVSRILHESARGVSLADIARQLNRDGVPTAQGGRRWWPSTVRVVLRTRLPRPPSQQLAYGLDAEEEPVRVTSRNAEVGLDRELRTADP